MVLKRRDIEPDIPYLSQEVKSFQKRESNEYELTFLSDNEMVNGIYKIKDKDYFICEASDLVCLLAGEVWYDEKIKIQKGDWASRSIYRSAEIAVLCPNRLPFDITEIYSDTYKKRTKLIQAFVNIRPCFDYKVLMSSLYSQYVKKIDQDGNVWLIEFGEYPQSVVDLDLALKLEYRFQKNELNKTGKKYHIPKSYYLGRKALGKNYDMEKYMTLNLSYIEYTFEGEKYIRIVSKTSNQGRLSNGLEIEDEKPYWIKVEPIKWCVNKEAQYALCDKCLLPRVEYNNYRNTKVYISRDFNDTSIKIFMDKYLKKEIIPSKVKKEEKSSVAFPLLEDIKMKISLEEELIREIKVYLERIKNTNYQDKIINKVDLLIENYNNKINGLNKQKILVTSDETSDGLKRSLIFELSLIKDEVKLMFENLSNYYEILNYIESLKDILNNKEIEFDTELKQDFKQIYNAIMFLENEKQTEYLDKFEDVLNNYQTKINNIVLNILNYKKELNNFNINKFELELRKDIHSLLFGLNKDVISYDSSKRILESVSLIIENNYHDNKSNIINYYMNIINGLYQDILNKYNLEESEIKELLDIIKTKIDTNKDLKDIIKQLTKLINNLYLFEFELMDRIKNKNIIENSLIKVKLKDILK